MKTTPQLRGNDFQRNAFCSVWENFNLLRGRIMGADLYIKTMPRDAQYRGFEVSIDAVEVGYFRDAYNGWGLFAVMSHTLRKEMSWWKIANNRKELFEECPNEGLVMTSEGVKQFWAEMQLIVRRFIKKKTYYRGEYQGRGKPFKRIQIRKQDDIKAIREHAELFARFHILACELCSPVIWSV